VGVGGVGVDGVGPVLKEEKAESMAVYLVAEKVVETGVAWGGGGGWAGLGWGERRWGQGVGVSEGEGG
jgi:hypothetical protein